MSKYIIINADDFGYNEQQTRAIRELYRDGLITSTSVLTVAPGAGEAARIAQAEHIPVGVHLTINSDSAADRWKSLTGGCSLSDDRGLRCSQMQVALHARRREVAVELEGQYAFLTQNGCTVDHADNHCGTLYGINGRRFYWEAYRFCARHRLPYRFPKSPAFIERQLGFRVPSPVIRLHRHIVSVGERLGVRQLDDLVSNPQSVEAIGDYEHLRHWYLDALDQCGDGVTEFFLHPAYPIEGDPGWQKRVWEFQLLRSGDLLQRAADRGIRVISWGEFQNMPSNSRMKG